MDNPYKFLRSVDRGEVHLGRKVSSEQAVRLAYKKLADEANLPPEYAERLVELFTKTHRG